MPLISYSNLHSDTSLQQTLWTADGTNSGLEYNMIDGHEKGGSGNTTAYVLASRWYIRLRSSTWGLTAKSTSYATAYPYDPVSKTWLAGLSWNTAQASGVGSNNTKDASRGHNTGDSIGIEQTYPDYACYHLWKVDFTFSHSGANTGTYNYCVFYPSYTMTTEAQFDKACKFIMGDEANGLKPIVAIQPRMMYISSSVTELTEVATGNMWRWYVPSEQYIINTFVDHEKLIFKDPFCTGIPLDGTGAILPAHRPNAKNICWTA